MKRLFFLISIGFIIAFMACEKDEVSTNEILTESVLVYSQKAPNSNDVNVIPFAIEYAGVYETNLYMGLSYTGGNQGHKFTASWNGAVVTEGDKKIVELLVYHNTTDDNGTSKIIDSLTLDLKDLNIPTDLQADRNFFYRIINTTNPSNAFLVQPSFSNEDADGDDNDDTTEGTTYSVAKVKVVAQEGCIAGLYGSYWLKVKGEDSYLLPLEVGAGIEYTAQESDSLEIRYQNVGLSDSSTYCSSWANINFKSVKVVELQKL